MDVNSCSIQVKMSGCVFFACPRTISRSHLLSVHVHPLMRVLTPIALRDIVECHGEGVRAWRLQPRSLFPSSPLSDCLCPQPTQVWKTSIILRRCCLNRLIYRSSNSPVPNIDDIRTQGDARSENSNTSKNGCEVESEKASDIVEKRRMRSSPDLHQEGTVLRQERRCGRDLYKSEKQFN